MAKEYIERETAIKIIDNYAKTMTIHDDTLIVSQAIRDIVDIICPTADVVEVVRCKDCVNYCGFERCNNGICDVDPVSKRAVYPTDFCSYGERKQV